MALSWKNAVCLLLAICLGCPAFAEQTLALFSLDKESEPLVELALAELSDEPELVLLERAEMARIQKELSLARFEDGFTPLPSLMQNVGLFIVVKEKAMEAFDGTTGVRLLDVPIDSAGSLSKSVRQAARKQRDFNGETLRRISCLPTVFANLSVEQGKRARKIDELMRRGLTNLPDVALLERRHLLLLLNEPNAAQNRLTKRLFASSIVLKTTISPMEDGGLHHVMEFYTPDGTELVQKQEVTIGSTHDIAAVIEKVLRRFPLPGVPAWDKADEARRFIDEAWFAVHQGLDNDALAAAASAGALDDDYENELCRISAISAQRALKKAIYCSKEMLRVGLLNLQTALAVASRQGIFPLELRLAFMALFSHSPADFRKRFAGQEELARTLTSRGIAAFMEMTPSPRRETAGMSVRERLSLLEEQSVYLFEFTSFVQVEWDVSYWEQFSLPVLKDFIDKSNHLFHECLGKDTGQWDEAEIQRRLGHVTFRTISRSLIQFYPKEQPPESHGVFERTFRLMASSRIIQYAVIGRFGLLKLSLGENGIANALNRQKDISVPLDAFYDDLIRIMENNLLCNGIDTLPSLVQSCIWDDPSHIEQKIRLQEIAMKRFHCANLLGDHLLYECEKWPQDTANRVYGKLEEWERMQPQEGDRIRYAKCRETLSRRCKLKRKAKGAQEPLMADVAFKNPMKPLKHLPYHWNITPLGFKDNRIYLLGNKSHDDDMTFTQILQVNPETGEAKTIQEYRGSFGEICGRGLFGAMTDTDYIAVDGYMLYFLPKDANANVRTVNLSQYGKECCHSMAFADQRVFMSLDGEFDNPGNLVEYNLQTQKTKVIASTIDRTIVWPMQGYGHPYAIAKAMPDVQNKRLLMLLHDKNKHQFKMQFFIRLWAYYWEDGKWEVLSDYLPVLKQDCSQGMDKNGAFWLSSDCGFGPLNKKGVWQPRVVFDNKGIADKIQSKPMFEGFDRLRVDYSKALAPDSRYPSIHEPKGFQMLSEKYFFSRGYLFNAETNRFYRLPFELSEPMLFNGRYLLTLPKTHDGDEMGSENLLLIDLAAEIR